MKTFLPKISEIKREWHEIDAAAFTLGRLATRAAILLRGKHKPTFTPHMDTGDFVVVINPARVKLSGRKLEQGERIRFSGYPGGITRTPLKELMAKNPEKIIWAAVRGMLDDNRLRSRVLTRLKFSKDGKHTYKIDHKIGL